MLRSASTRYNRTPVTSFNCCHPFSLSHVLTCAAFGVFQVALGVWPGYPLGHSHLAVSLKAIGDEQGALRHLEAALRLDPQDHFASTQLAQIREARGEYTEACNLWRECLRRAPGDNHVRRRLADSLMKLGDPVRAFVQYESVLQQQPENQAAQRGLEMAETAIRVIEQQAEILRRTPGATPVAGVSAFESSTSQNTTSLLRDSTPLEEAMREERAYWDEASRVSGESAEVYARAKAKARAIESDRVVSHPLSDRLLSDGRGGSAGSEILKGTPHISTAGDSGEAIHLEKRTKDAQRSEQDADAQLELLCDMEGMASSQSRTDGDSGGSGGSEEQVPRRFICPITHEVMISPTIASDGHTYERAAITVWFEHHPRSPLTNETVAHTDLYPNHLLRAEIFQFFEGREAMASEARFYERLKEDQGEQVHLAQPVHTAPPLSPNTLARLQGTEARAIVEQPRAVVDAIPGTGLCSRDAASRACSLDCPIS